MAYTTKAAVKAYLGITGAGDDELIDGLIVAAQGVIDDFCGRTFEAGADTTRTFDAIGPHVTARALYLDRDLCAITSITNGDGIALASNEYVTIGDGPFWAIRIKGSAGKVWTYGTDWEAAIRIVGKWAYSAAPPDVIKQACVRMTAFMYRQKDAQMMDVTAIEAGVVLAPVGIPADVRQMLSPYRVLT